MNPRAAFFIDGFNLYHSLAAYAKESGDHSLKWLDLIGLAKGWAEYGVRPLLVSG
jgi:hypothetical protein